MTASADGTLGLARHARTPGTPDSGTSWRVRQVQSVRLPLAPALAFSPSESPTPTSFAANLHSAGRYGGGTRSTLREYKTHSRYGCVRFEATDRNRRTQCAFRRILLAEWRFAWRQLLSRFQ